MITDEDRDAICAAYLAGEPVKVIAARFGCGIGLPTYLAKRRGLPMRQIRPKGLVKARLGGALKARLQIVAKRERKTPDVLIREAVSAYLRSAA